MSAPIHVRDATREGYTVCGLTCWHYITTNHEQATCRDCKPKVEAKMSETAYGQDRTAKDCPEDCGFCSGETCWQCHPRQHCTHDVLERHTSPSEASTPEYKELRELRRWKAEALVAMGEREEWLSKFNAVAVDLGAWGKHYLKAAYEIAVRCKAAEAKLASLQDCRHCDGIGCRACKGDCE